MRRKPTSRGAKVLRPVHPNAGIEAVYKRRIRSLVDLMNRSVVYWLAAAYRAHEPAVAILARDAKKPTGLPAKQLRAAVRALAKEWQEKFDEAAPKLADYFATSVEARSAATLRGILKDAGVSVKFRTTRAQRDILEATIAENVSLIRSIPSQHFTKIEGMVMRSVQTGRDLEQLSTDLRKAFGVTKRRAALIARDQNNKATAAMTRARQLELGLDKAVWMHSGGGKEPRPVHVKWGKDKQTYDVAKGMWDPVERSYVWPGTLINCRCTSRTIVPGF